MDSSQRSMQRSRQLSRAGRARRPASRAAASISRLESVPAAACFAHFACQKKTPIDDKLFDNPEIDGQRTDGRREERETRPKGRKRSRLPLRLICAAVLLPSLFFILPFSSL